MVKPRWKIGETISIGTYAGRDRKGAQPTRSQFGLPVARVRKMLTREINLVTNGKRKVSMRAVVMSSLLFLGFLNLGLSRSNKIRDRLGSRTSKWVRRRRGKGKINRKLDISAICEMERGKTSTNIDGTVDSQLYIR